MKKIILMAAIAVFSISSYAQVSFGAQVGANLGMGKETYGFTNAPTLSSNAKVGFLIGVLAEVGFGKLAFRPELNFVQRGSKSGVNFYNGFSTSSYSRKLTLNYIDIPLNVVYKLEIGKTGKVFFGLGPAIEIGLSGKDDYADQDNNGNPFTKHDVKFDGKKAANTSSNDFDTHYKRVDIGANVLAGFQLPMGVFAKLGYNLGFANIDPNKDDPNYLSTYKNRGFNICVGYMLGSKK
ncbi:MAG: porin family protein [Ferruginibacter sp.]